MKHNDKPLDFIFAVSYRINRSNPTALNARTSLLSANLSTAVGFPPEVGGSKLSIYCARFLSEIFPNTY